MIGALPATLAMMFLQSHQDTIHVFPDWPKSQCVHGQRRSERGRDLQRRDQTRLQSADEMMNRICEAPPKIIPIRSASTTNKAPATKAAA